MEKNDKNPKGEKGGNRLAHLREIEKSYQELWEKNKIFEAKPEEMSFFISLGIKFNNSSFVIKFPNSLNFEIKICSK